MRIAILHTHLLHWMGGTRFIYEVAKRLKRKCDVDIYVHQSSTYVQSKFAEIDCPLINLSHVSSNNKRYWFFLPFYVRADVEALRKVTHKYDAFLATYFPMNWVATRLSKRAIYLCFEPFVWFHDPVARHHNLSPIMKLLIRGSTPFYVRYDLEGTRRSERVLTLSNFIASRIKKIYGVEAVVVREGVDIEFFTKKYSPELQKRYSNNKVILHTTSYGYTKRTDLLLEALPKVKHNVPSVRLLITNTRDDEKVRNKLMRRAKELGVHESIEFLSFLEEEMLPYYYSLASVVVQPSQNEAASLPIKEAMACETPVIGSYGDGSEEDIGDSRYGFLVHQGDVNELAEYITTILLNSDLAESMGRKGRERVSKLFSWDSVANAIWHVISKKEKNSDDDTPQDSRKPL